MIELHLGGLGFDPKNMSPIVLLKDGDDRNFLPIWIGMFEAAAIAMELQDIKPPRPMTHDLLINVLKSLQATVERILITDIQEGTFFATIEVRKEGATDVTVIDSRPSDAIALAVRVGCKIYVAETVMSKAKMVNTEKDEEETQQFKAFIDTIQPQDFSKYYDER